IRTSKSTTTPQKTAACRIPDTYRIPAIRKDARTVRRECNGSNLLRETAERANEVPGRRLAYIDHKVDTDEHVLAVRRECDWSVLERSPKCVKQTPAARLPKHCHCAEATRDDLRSIRRKGHGLNCAPMVSLKVPDETAARSIPKLQALVPAPREHAPAVGREGNGADPTRMSCEGPEQPSTRDFPELYGCIVAARNGIGPIRRQCSGDHGRRMAAETANNLPPSGVPKLERVVA